MRFAGAGSTGKLLSYLRACFRVSFQILSSFLSFMIAWTIAGLAALDELERKTPSQSMNTSSYFFPDPLNSQRGSTESDCRDSLTSEGLSSVHLFMSYTYRDLLISECLSSVRLSMSSATTRSSLHSLSDSDDDNNNEQSYLLSLPLTPRRAPAKEHKLVGVLPTSCTPHNSVSNSTPFVLLYSWIKQPQKTGTGEKGHILEAALPPSRPFLLASSPPPRAAPPPSRPFILASSSPKKKTAKIATSTESEAVLQPLRPPPFIVAPSSPSLKIQGVPVQQRSSNSDAKVTQRHRSKKDVPLHEPVSLYTHFRTWN